MAERIDLFDSTYSHFTDRVLDAVRKETFGADIGQNSWVTADEYERFIRWLDLAPGHYALEVASGSGGPALYLARSTGCHVMGIDANERGVATASEMAAGSNESERVRFTLVDATKSLPFEEMSLDGFVAGPDHSVESPLGIGSKGCTCREPVIP